MPEAEAVKPQDPAQPKPSTSLGQLAPLFLKLDAILLLRFKANSA